MDLLQVHETQAGICNVIFVSHDEQSLFPCCCSSLLSLIAQHSDIFWKIKMSNAGGFFFPKFLLTNPGDVLEYTVGVGPLPEDEPRNWLQAHQSLQLKLQEWVKFNFAIIGHDCILADVARSASWLRPLFLLRLSSTVSNPGCQRSFEDHHDFTGVSPGDSCAGELKAAWIFSS